MILFKRKRNIKDKSISSLSNKYKTVIYNRNWKYEYIYKHVPQKPFSLSETNMNISD